MKPHHRIFYFCSFQLPLLKVFNVFPFQIVQFHRQKSVLSDFGSSFDERFSTIFNRHLMGIDRFSWVSNISSQVKAQLIFSVCSISKAYVRTKCPISQAKFSSAWCWRLLWCKIFNYSQPITDWHWSVCISGNIGSYKS